MISYYQKMKEKTRQKAIDWQLNNSDSCSIEELWEDQQHFITLGKKYGLIEEFRENGVI